MQGKQKSSVKRLEQTIQELIQNPRNKDRVTSLAPYIAQIQRRKKLRGLAKQSKKNLNQSSSRSFRIKQKSLTSLHKEALLKTRQTTTNSVIARLLQNRALREQRTRSIQRHRDTEYSKTIQHRPKEMPSPTSNCFFNQLYGKIRGRVEKQKTMRKGKYETIQGTRSRSEQAGDINIQKIGFTNATEQQKPKKGKIRRNKFQVESQPTLTLQRNEFQQPKDTEALQRKQSNLSINQEMDKLMLKQMREIRQTRSKELKQIVDRKNSQFFKVALPGQGMSKNDIQVFTNNVKLPTPKRVAISAHEQLKTDRKQLIYDFQFPSQPLPVLNLGQIEDYDMSQADGNELELQTEDIGLPMAHLK